jgi:hypothetical protein
MAGTARDDAEERNWPRLSAWCRTVEAVSWFGGPRLGKLREHAEELAVRIGAIPVLLLREPRSRRPHACRYLR